jgi:hypothetical protein
MQVFEKQWFKVHQAKLLKLFNSAIGKEILELRIPKDKLIIDVTPHSIAYVVGWNPGLGTCRVVHKVHKRKVYAEALAVKFKWLWKTMHFLDSICLDHQKLIPDFGFATYDELFGKDEGTTPEDEDGCRREVNSAPESFGVIRAGIGTDTSGEQAGWQCGGVLRHSASSNLYSYLIRNAVILDTSVIGNIAREIDNTAVVATMYGGLLRHLTGGTPYAYTGSNSAYCMVDPNLTSNVSVVYSDYERFTSNRLAPDILEANFNTGSPASVSNVQTWYSSAVDTYLNIDGYTQMGFTFKGDVDNITPVWNSGSTYAMLCADWISSTAGYSADLSVGYELPLKINIGDSWKAVEEIYINIGDVWKNVTEMKINISDVWKDVN